MSIIGSNILAGSAGQGGGYTIENSLRFRSSASAYLSRTPASAGNRKTWTWNAWVKRGKLTANNELFSCYIDASNYFRFYFFSSDVLRIRSNVSGSTTNLDTTALFRDASAWYHIVLKVDTTQATASERVKLYINGSLQDLSSTIGQNTDYAINSTNAHSLGYYNGSYFDGYLTEVNFIDGQALTPSDFGNYNEDTGVWQPAKYTGSYGTNGFYLPFSDATTTTTLAADASGNGNDWTPNNISLTSGVTYDSMTDTPTPYADGGNYAVLNPLSSENSTLSDGNLNVLVTSSTSVKRYALSSFVLTSGKWYTEFTALSTSCSVGAADILTLGNSSYFGHLSGDYSFAYSPTGVLRINGIGSSYGDTFTTGDVIGIALDMDTGAVWFSKNGVWLNSATSSEITAGITTDAATTWTVNSREYCIGASGSNTKCAINFGQRPFAYTPPTGFKALHTGNLPDSAIVDGGQYFDTVLYTGNGGTQSITGVGFQPDLVWGKTRSDAVNHALYDAVRGATLQLSSADTNAESTVSDGLTSFDADGFSLGDGTRLNTSGRTYVAWNWKANGAGVSNTDGSITSTVSANPTSGFSIVSWNQTASGTVGHGLNQTPDLWIIKDRDRVSNWYTYTQLIDGSMDYLLLNTSGSKVDSSVTAPTDTVFSTTNTLVNTSNNGIAYCFHSVEGYSKFGIYTGNGSSDGVFVHLGFRARYLLIKASSTSGYSWNIIDTARDTYNTQGLYLFANTSGTEGSGSNVDILSNGFKLRNAGAGVNGSGITYIYMAFAENPFKNSLAR